MNYQQLQTELENEAYQNLDAAQCVALLNEQNIEYFVQPPTPEVTNFLFNNGMYMKLLAVYRDHPDVQIRVAAEAAIDLAASQIPELNLENANTQTMMAALVTGGVWTQAEADSLLNFAKRTRSRAEAEFGRLLTENDVNRARWSEQVAAFEAVIDLKQQELAILKAQRDDLATGNAYHELGEVG
jgi:hypothetical protein